MPHPQPQWLNTSVQDSHLAFALKTLAIREAQRESARIVRTSSPPNTRPRIPHLHLSRHAPSTSQLEAYFSCSVGQQPAHKRANRYLAIEPYNRTRVLAPNPDCDGRFTGDAESSDNAPRYLNANWVRESAGGKWWIAGQAPLPNTAHAFMTLGIYPVAPSISSMTSSSSIRTRRVQTIVQLTPLIESGRRRAHPYFPTALREDMIIMAEPGCDAPPIHVHVANQEKIDSAQCIRTDLRLRWGSAQNSSDAGSNEAKEWSVTHLLYTAWPDFGVPEDNHSILNFARLAESLNNRHLDQPSDDPNASPPILVHCSAGVGRTGSFIALCSLLRAHTLLSSHTPPSHLNSSLAPPLPISPLGPLPDALRDDLVAREIDCLREQRTAMVQREEQAMWVYEALGDAFDGM